MPILKQTFTHSEMQNLIEQLNALQVNGEQVVKAYEGNWRMDGMYLTLESDRNVAYIFLPLTRKQEDEARRSGKEKDNG